MVKREINSGKLGPLQLRLESPTCVNYSKSAAFLPPSGPYQTTKTINASIIYPFETKIVPFLKILPISWKAIVNQAAGITVNRPLIPLFIDSYLLFYATDHYLSPLATTLYHVTIAFFRKNTRVKSYRQNQLIGPFSNTWNARSLTLTRQYNRSISGEIIRDAPTNFPTINMLINIIW